MHAVRVITWNMGMADRWYRFAKTHEEAWRYLLGLSPDLAFMQETLLRTGDGLLVDDGAREFLQRRSWQV